MAADPLLRLHPLDQSIGCKRQYQFNCQDPRSGKALHFHHIVGIQDKTVRAKHQKCCQKCRGLSDHISMKLSLPIVPFAVAKNLPDIQKLQIPGCSQQDQQQHRIQSENAFSGIFYKSQQGKNAVARIQAACCFSCNSQLSKKLRNIYQLNPVHKGKGQNKHQSIHQCRHQQPCFSPRFLLFQTCIQRQKHILWFHNFLSILPLKICLNILKHMEKLKSLRILLTASLCMLWRL